MSAVELAKALQTKLNADQSVGSFYAAVGGRIYGYEAPEDLTTYPYLVWQFLGSDQNPNFSGAMSHTAQVQFDLYGTRAAGMSALGDVHTKLITLLEGAAIAPTGFDRGLVRVTRQYEPSSDEDVCHIMCEAEIRGTDF